MRNTFNTFTFNTNAVVTPTATFNPERVTFQDDYCAIDMNEQGHNNPIRETIQVS